MLKVSELSAIEAATSAKKIWRNPGEQKAGQQLLYYALAQDSNCPLALFVLADMLRSLTEDTIAIVVADHINELVSDEKIKSRLTLLRRLTLNKLDLLSHPANDIVNLPIADWEHSPDFTIDNETLAKLKARVLGKHTPEQAFAAACLFVGVRAGLMVSKNNSALDTNFEDCFEPVNFEKSKFYDEFLVSEKFEYDF